MEKARKKHNTKGYSIEKRNDTTYRIVVSNGYDHLNRQIREKKTIKINPDDFSDSHELMIYLEMKAIEFKKLVLSGEYIKKRDEVVTFKDGVNYFLKACDGSNVRKGVRNTSKDAYKRALNVVLKGDFANAKIKNIKKKDIADFMNSLNYSENYCILILKVIKMVFNTIIDDELIDGFTKNPCANVQFVKKEKNKKAIKKRALEINELKEFLEITKENNVYFNVVNFSFMTACRPMEALGLTMDSIDFNNNTIKIDKTLVYINNQYEFHPPKNGETRTVHMNQSLKKLLLNQIELNKKIKTAFPIVNDDLIFISNRGGYLSYQVVASYIRRKIKNCSFADVFTWKQLRHTAISYLQWQGFSSIEISKIAGHSAIIDEQVYTHLINEQRQSMGNALDMQNYLN